MTCCCQGKGNTEGEENMKVNKSIETSEGEGGGTQYTLLGSKNWVHLSVLFSRDWEIMSCWEQGG